MTTERGAGSGSETDATRRGWLANIPMWARIVVPVLVVLIVIAGVIAGMSVSNVQDDPDEVVQALCHDAALEEMDSTGRQGAEVSQSFDVTAVDDEEYRVQGTATFEDEDGSTQAGNVRCVVREEDGALEVASVRLSF
jgi:predicted exporter